MHLTTNTGYRTQTSPCVLVGSAFYDPVLFRWHFPGALVSCHLTYLANFYCFTLFIDCQQVILRWQSYMWPEQSQLKRYIYICSDTEYRTWPGRKKIELSWYFRVKVIIQKWHLHFNLDFVIWIFCLVYILLMFREILKELQKEMSERIVNRINSSEEINNIGCCSRQPFIFM